MIRSEKTTPCQRLRVNSILTYPAKCTRNKKIFGVRLRIILSSKSKVIYSAKTDSVYAQLFKVKYVSLSIVCFGDHGCTRACDYDSS